MGYQMFIGGTSDVNWAAIGFVCTLLFLFGVGYNHLVMYLERKHYDEGYTALLVVVGVAITLIGVAILFWQAAVITLLCFAASGLPMIVGSAWRHVQLREKAQKAAINANAKTLA